MKTYKIKVNKNNIKKGIPGDDCNCPIALACKRIFKEKLTISSNAINFSKEEKSVYLPKRAQNFIDNFDMGNKVKPFVFRLRMKD